MNNFLEQIKKKIKKNIKIEKILIIDNSSLDRKHKLFNVEKYHLNLKIESAY